MPPSSTFTPSPDAWDIVLATSDSDTDPLTMMLVQDDSVAMWEGVDAPSLATDQAVYREIAVMWKPDGPGVGYSRRTNETTSAGPDGQIVSTGTSYGENATFVVPGLAMPAGKRTQEAIDAAITAQAGRIFDAQEFGTAKDVYFTTGTQYLLKVASGNGAVSIAKDFGAGVDCANMVVFDGLLIVTCGTTAPIQVFDGTTWTAGAASCKASRVDKVNWNPSDQIMGGSGGGTSADHLILTDPSGVGFYHVVSGNDVKVFSNWISSGGSPIPVGEETYPIQNIVASPRVVWFAKPNGLHGLYETGRTVNLTPWMERSYHESNGGTVAFYSDENQALVFYAHQFGLVAVTVNGSQQETARFVQFGGRTPNETPIWGRPRWIAPHVDGIFVAYYDDTTTTSYIMRLILEKDGGYRWSGSECTIVGEEVTFLKVTSPDGKPRLWIGTVTDAGVVALSWQSLPETGNPWVDSVVGTDHQYATDWTVYLPRDDAGSSAEKVVRRYDLVGRGITNGNTVTVQASGDDGAYVTQGEISSGPRSSFIATTYVQAVWFNYKLICQNGATAPIALETFQARVSVLPEQSDVWTFRCQLAAGQGLENDAEDLQDPYTVRTRLRALQRRGPVVMRRSPLSREALTVKVEQGARLQTVWSRKDRANLVVLTFTISVLHESAAYGAAVYGSAIYGEDSAA